VLEHPSEHIFRRELKRQYDIVGISFNLPFFSRVIKMAKMVREMSPRSKIVIGGPGVQCFARSTGKENELLSLVDGVCHGEGVRYMREMTGENPDKPIKQDLPLGAIIPFRQKFLRQESATLISRLGCSNGCDFCAASAFFNHRRIQIADPKELFLAVRDYLAKYNISSARILDDNFLNEPEYVREFGRLLLNDPLCRRRNFTFCTFSSLQTISQYDYEELVRYGLSGVLIGFESKFVDQMAPRVKKKLKNLDARKMVSDLVDHAIFIEGSMILGWDFQERGNVMEDIDYYVSLGATLDQIVPLIPLPETRMWKQLQLEGRLFDDLSWDTAGFYSKWHRFKNFTHEELWKYEDIALKKAYGTWGPSYLRYFEVQLRGYRKFKNSRDGRLREIAEMHRKECADLYPIFECCEVFAPNEAVRQRVENLRESYYREFGAPSIRNRLKSSALVAIGAKTQLQQRLFKENTVQPRSEVYHYPHDGRQEAMSHENGLTNS
jgi:haloalkane dehalogenase